MTAKAFFRARQFAARFFRAVFFRGEDAAPPSGDTHDGAEVLQPRVRVQLVAGLTRGYVLGFQRAMRLSPVRTLVLTTSPQEFVFVPPVSNALLGPTTVPPLLTPLARTQVLTSEVERLCDVRERVTVLSRQRILVL